MEIAIVTHADTPLGARIAQDLVQLGYRVYGVGADFSKSIFKHPCFKELAVKLTDQADLKACIKQLQSIPARASLLVHAMPSFEAIALQESNLKDTALYIERYITFQVHLTQLCLKDLLVYQGSVFFVAQEKLHLEGTNAMQKMVTVAMDAFASGLREDLKLRGVKVISIKSMQKQGQEAVTPSQDTYRAIALTIEDMLRYKREKFVTHIVLEEGAAVTAKEKMDHRARQQGIALPQDDGLQSERLIRTPCASKPIEVKTYQEPSSLEGSRKSAKPHHNTRPQNKPKTRVHEESSESSQNKKGKASSNKVPLRRRPPGKAKKPQPSLHKAPDTIVVPPVMPPAKKKIRRGRPPSQQVGS